MTQTWRDLDDTDRREAVAILQRWARARRVATLLAARKSRED